MPTIELSDAAISRIRQSMKDDAELMAALPQARTFEERVGAPWKVDRDGDICGPFRPRRLPRPAGEGVMVIETQRVTVQQISPRCWTYVLARGGSGGFFKTSKEARQAGERAWKRRAQQEGRG